jgi:uncharacterized protein (TIGR02996 family)
MSQVASFVQAILDDPGDDSARLIFADWLEDQHDRALNVRGEFLRLQVRLAQWVPDLAERTALQVREQALLHAHQADWVSELASFCTEIVWQRGLVQVAIPSTRIAGKRFVVNGGRLLDQAWVETVRVERKARLTLHAALVAKAAILGHAAGIDLSCNQLDDERLAPVLRSPHLGRLRRLNLSSNRLTDQSVLQMLDTPWAGQLRELDLRNNEIGSFGARILLDSPLSERLQVLELHGNPLDMDALDAFHAWQISRQRTSPGQLPRRISNNIGMELTLIPAGTFLMGAPIDALERGPLDQLDTTHPVTIRRPFYLGVYPVTQRQYEQVMGQNPSHFHSGNRGGPDHPVEYVSWREAQTFCKKLSAQAEEIAAGRVYRLPTEAEWEHACRAGTTTPFSFGAPVTSYKVNYDGNHVYAEVNKGPFLEHTTPVGAYPPNAFGLYDMHGNVWEWCQDWYGEKYYLERPPVDPTGPARGKTRVIKGGCWDCVGWYCRSAHRHGDAPTHRDEMNGFRVAVSVN